MIVGLGSVRNVRSTKVLKQRTATTVSAASTSSITTALGWESAWGRGIWNGEFYDLFRGGKERIILTVKWVFFVRCFRFKLFNLSWVIYFIYAIVATFVWLVMRSVGRWGFSWRGKVCNFNIGKICFWKFSSYLFLIFISLTMKIAFSISSNSWIPRRIPRWRNPQF